MRPHHYIFNRDWYEFHGGLAQFGEYQNEFSKLAASEKFELLSLIASVGPCDIRNQIQLATTKRVQSIMRHYVPLSKNQETAIWAQQRSMQQRVDHSIIVPDDERVEDAGLYAEDSLPSKMTTTTKKAAAVA